MSLADPQFPSSEAFDFIKTTLESSEDAKKQFIKQANMLVQFDIRNPAGQIATWYIDAKKTGAVGKGKPESKPDVAVVVADADFKKLVDGKANAQRLFLSGKLKVRGDVMKAANLPNVLKSAKSKL